jgi:hypothetical protein
MVDYGYWIVGVGWSEYAVGLIANGELEGYQYQSHFPDPVEPVCIPKPKRRALIVEIIHLIVERFCVSSAKRVLRKRKPWPFFKLASYIESKTR